MVGGSTYTTNLLIHPLRFKSPIVIFDTLSWLFFAIPLGFFLAGLVRQLDWYMIAMYGYFSTVHAFHVAVRHATTPYSDYNRYFTEEISKEEFLDQLSLDGGIYTTPKRADRELSRAFVTTGVNRCLTRKIEFYDCALKDYTDNLRNRNYYKDKVWDVN